MTAALKNMVQKINILPAKEQNAIATLLSEELAWNKSYNKTQHELSSLTAEAVSEYRKRKTRPLNLR